MAKTTEQLQQEGLRALRNPRLEYVLGVDEVGYGAWAGPVVVCAAVVPAAWLDSRIRDSKAFKSDDAHHARKQLVQNVLPAAVRMHQIVAHDSETIDKMGVARARDDLVKKAVRACLERFPTALVVMDGNQLPAGLPSNALCFPKADALVPAVSAASLFAKVWRDELMIEFHAEYPWYDFDSNVGYGTPKHQAGLAAHGPCLIHRRSYRNIEQVAAHSTMKRRAAARVWGWQPSRNATPGSTRSSKR